jgi:hypothetical protein
LGSILRSLTANTISLGGAGGDFGGIDFSKLGGGGMPDMGGDDEDDEEDDDDMPPLEGEEEEAGKPEEK